MPAITDLPLDVLEQIILLLDPLEVAATSRTCSAFYAYIYSSPDTERLWRTLYLSQPLDDPRKCSDHLGYPCDGAIDWRDRLQRTIRARTIIVDPSKCRPEERCTVLRTLLDTQIFLVSRGCVASAALSRFHTSSSSPTALRSSAAPATRTALHRDSGAGP